MAATKSRTELLAATLTAGAGDTSSAWIDLSAIYGAIISIQLTNGGTGPTLPAQVEIEVANNYNAGVPTIPVELITVIGGVTIAGVYEWHVPIDLATAAVRINAGSNTGQDVVIAADISEVEGL